MGDSNCALDDWEKPFKSEKERITNEVHQKFSKAKSDTTFAFVLFILTVIILGHSDNYHSEYFAGLEPNRQSRDPPWKGKAVSDDEISKINYYEVSEFFEGEV